MESAQNNGVVTRLAPSPTGKLHCGTARTALFNYLFTKKHDGKLILRSEDTDKERSKKEFEDDILTGLNWLGIEHDEFHRQSERGAVYREHLERLIADGHAYVSEEKEGASKEVIRFRNSGTKVQFTDLIRGEVEVDTTDLGDFVIAKDLDTPLYHLAVVVDDYSMGVTHIIRGDDGISNTPRQILIQDALGAPRPVYAHIPLILGADRSKLSKRHGAVSLLDYRDKGYLPEAMINFLAFLGWNPGTDEEIFSLNRLAQVFDISKVQKGGAIFNIEKLDWYNRQYLQKLPPNELEHSVSLALRKHFDPTAVSEIAGRLTPVLLERINTLSDIDTMVEEGELAYYFEEPTIDAKKLINKKDREDGDGKARTKEYLESIIGMLEDHSEDAFNALSLKELLWPFAEEKGKGSVLWPMRFALSGKERSPDPFALAEILGKSKTLVRLKNAVDLLR